MISDELNAGLAKLNLHYLSQNLRDFVASAIKHRWSSQQTLEQMVRNELTELARRSVERRLGAAKLGRFKPLADFDWGWPKQIDRQAVEDLMTVKFVDEQANIILFGPSGCGKTMIAKNLTNAAVMAGHTALCTDAFSMLTDLEQQESPRQLKNRLTKYLRPKVLIIDELGYLSYTTKAADLLFRVVSGRYQTGSTILSTNVPFKDWTTIFPTASCLGALVDRLMHRAELLVIDADSYRKKEADERKSKKSKPKITGGRK